MKPSWRKLSAAVHRGLIQMTFAPSVAAKVGSLRAGRIAMGRVRLAQNAWRRTSRAFSAASRSHSAWIRASWSVIIPPEEEGRGAPAPHS